MNQLPFIRFVFYLALMVLAPAMGKAQEYNYKHYDARSGLANSYVYQMLQDKEGFIWFATQIGLSRFDGTHFKNFSTADGLPGNSIIRMFEDSRGRIWLMPFRRAICYYYKGKIHNQENDSALKNIELTDFVRDVVENKNKELLFTDSRKLYHIDAQDNVRIIGQELAGSHPQIQIGVKESGDFYVRFARKLYTTDGNTFSFLGDLSLRTPTVEHLILRDSMTCWMDMNTLYVESAHYGKLCYKKFIGPVNSMYLLSDTLLCLNTPQGTRFYNLLQQKIEQRFLPNGNVNHFLADKEGGYWFATQKEGVFRLSSPVFKSIVGYTEAGQKLGVYALQKIDDDIWAGCDMGRIMKVRNNAVDVMSLRVDGEVLGRHLVYGIAARGKRIAAGCGNYVFMKGDGDQFSQQLAPGSIKAIAWKSDHDLLVATSSGLSELRIDGAKEREKEKENAVHSVERNTDVYYRNDSTWFGTLTGLYFMTPGLGITNLGKDNPLLNVPIVSIRGGLNGTIWVATAGSGVVGLQNNKVIWHFGKHNGLNSDMVRCIGIDSGAIWAGTERELNNIPLRADPLITRYAYSDEFNSELISTLLVDGNIVYAGTPGGITWFDKREPRGTSICDLKLLGVAVNEEEKELQQRYVLPYRNNNIRFDYVAISMKSDGNIVYNYRLNGLDTSWKSTTQTSLELISLPPGTYKLELFAVNKFDVKSEVYSVNIVVQTPFWKSTWFTISAIVLTALVTWFLGMRHNRAVIGREKSRRRTEEQLRELEEKALRAQMNPHFIFNCLHSIQGFILENEPEKANKYLTRFASLIRLTLENSFKSFVSLTDEINYLNTYLQLEQFSSESEFEYRITVEEGLPTDVLSTPVMIIQPFVENAVQHGVQCVTGRSGQINISFSRSDGELVCRIEDNGIGRQQSQLQKTNNPTGHRSRGMQLTHERIELLNANSSKQITVEIVDKFNELNEPGGTDVTIRFPIFTTKDTNLL